MIYMVEMALDDTAREAEWHDWYLRHIRKLLTVPGFRASQRFRAVTATASPFVALHEVEDAGVLSSPQYRALGGRANTGEWQHRMSNWHRNLLEGLEQTPDVPERAYLLVIDERSEAKLPAETELHWLRAVGLDRTVQNRALAIVGSEEPFASLCRRDERLRLFCPITAKLRADPQPQPTA